MRYEDQLTNPQGAVSALILTAGHARELLRIRAQVLRQAGFRVIEESRTSQVARIAAEKRVDLVLLCHTITAPEQEQIIAEISTLDKAPMIALISPIEQRAERDDVPSIPGTARDLVNGVRAILAEGASALAGD